METLSKFYLFENLNSDQLEKLHSISKTVDFKKGSILFFEGEKPKSLILLTDGVLQIYKTDQKGNKIVLHNFFPNSLIAEIVNLEKIPYPASAEFITDGQAVLIDYEKFEKNFLRNPDFCFIFIKSLTKKIKYLEDVITNNVVMNSTSRVAKYIYEHEHEFAKLKKSQIAEKLHMAPETLSRILKKLKTMKLIEKSESGFKIINKEGLKSIYE
ncbi:Crp/Fnr family transcriptional regulator [Nitrosophilus kaiyonis]|uniref:Crp/Fnr family transcriptional regulator n=1 Tax=Nitrosophilus kaiyonis TaxID=2930200 RepID=UPI00248F6AF5|nr:Crp/Fnr family transcriptional regulator [Nitrosophilus kaiyonis]